jgi:hypothetical protein
VALTRVQRLLRKVVSAPRPLLHVGLPVAAALTLGAVTVGVVAAEQPAASGSAISVSAPVVRAQAVSVRVAPISRSEDRVALAPKPKVTGHLFATDTVNIRLEPSEQSRRMGALEWGEKIPVTGQSRGVWVEVVLDEKSRWVHGAFLSDTKPRPEPEPEPEPEPDAPAGVSGAPCPTSDVESGLVPNAVAVHRAVCNAFPQITSYGGLRADSGSHGTGRALDIMISGESGWTVAEFVRANAGTLGVSEVIFSQKIWTTDRSGDGWRWMEDRGSTTANHYDHVHVTVY